MSIWSLAKRKTPCLLMVLAGAAAFAATGYQVGLLHWLGSEDFHQVGYHFSSSSRGASVGLDTFYLSQGSHVRLDYDIDVQAGSLGVYVYQLFAPAHERQTVLARLEESSSGTLDFEAPESGLYSLSFSPSPLGGPSGGDRLYDVDYQINWGVY